MVFFLTIGYVISFCQQILLKGDFVVTTNAGRAVYIVYSLFTIPIMTILISFMSDAFLSKFQKRAERFGLKGGEDQRYSERARKGKVWESGVKKLFRRWRRRKSTEEDNDLESGRSPPTGDEVLRNEILDEVRSIQENVDEEVPEPENGDENKSSLAASRELDEDEVEGGSNGESSAHRRKSKREKELDDIDEEDVERAIKENRGELDKHED